MANFPTRDAKWSEQPAWSSEDWEKGWREEMLPCDRCGGEGRVFFTGVHGGVCFKCSGRKRVKGRAYTPEYRAELDAKSDRRKERKREREDEQRFADFKTSLLAHREAHDVAATIADEVALHGRAGAIDKYNDFIVDVALKGVDGPLTEKQASALVDAYNRALEWAEKQAAANEGAKDAPLGRRTFMGEVVHTKVYENHYRGASTLAYKMLMKVTDDDGWWKAWMTIPKQALETVSYDDERLRGKVMTVTATLSPGKNPDEPEFVVGSRPQLVIMEDA